MNVRRLSKADYEFIFGVKEVDCYRFDSEDRTFRSVSVDKKRLLTLPQVVRYLALKHDVQTSAEVLREAVYVGDLDCHVVKTPSQRKPINLGRVALRFTRCQIDRSDWLYTEMQLNRMEREQGAGLALHAKQCLRHPGTVALEYRAVEAAMRELRENGADDPKAKTH